MRKVDVIFEEMDDNKDGVITKYLFKPARIYRNEYIKKCLEAEDAMLYRINQKVVKINAFKNQYEETVKKLTISKVNAIY